MLGVLLEQDYESEVDPGTRTFWQELPKSEHLFAKHHLLAMHGKQLAKGAYEYTADKMKKHNIDVGDLTNKFMEIMRIEQSHKDKLKEIAKDITAEIWGIDRGMLDAELTMDMSQTDAGYDEFEPEDMTPEIRAEVNKRITLNTMAHGSAVHIMQTAHYMMEKALKKISPRLLQLYSELAVGSVHQYWLYDIMGLLENLSNMRVGEEFVAFDTSDDTPTVVARGALFPVLVQELSKGVMELLTMHGLPKDENTLKTVLHYADRMEDEPWLIQVGPELWRRFLEVVPKEIELSELVAALSEQEPSTVNDIVVSVVENPDNAREMLSNLIKADQEEDESYVDDVTQK